MATSRRVGRLRVIARRLRVVLVAATLAGGLLQVTGPSIALASDGYVEKGTTTYTLNPAAGRVDVAIDVSLKNTTRSTSTTIYYFNAEYVWVEHQATNVRAASVGSHATITVSRVKRQQYYDEYKIRFEPVIFYGSTRKLHITYQIPSGTPRSSSPIRVGKAYADFCVISTGADGASTTVKVPTDFEMSVDAHEGTLTGTKSGSTMVYTTGNVKSSDFWACLTGENEKGYATASVQSPSGRTIELESWPEDRTWTDEVEGQLDKIVVDLEALVGRGLPGSGPIVLREVGNGTLGAYAGFFDSKTSIARVGEELAQGGVIAHELSHAWFNDSLFDAHWLREGWAEWARASVTDDPCSDPTTYPSPGLPNVKEWKFAGPKPTDEELAVIDYQYQAACAIISDVATKIGLDRMRTVLKSLFENEIAYRTGHTVLKASTSVRDWKRWLDAVDELGLVAAGITDLDYAQGRLKKFGIVPSGYDDLLAARSKARATFHRLNAAIGDWSIPEAILQPMGDWKFDVATTAMSGATATYAKAGEVAAALADVDGRQGKVRQLFEAAKTQADLDAALQAAADEVASAKLVAAARVALNAPEDFVTQVGLLGVTILQPTLAAAIAAVAANDLTTANEDAATIQSTLAGAPQTGQTRIAAVVGAVILLVLLIVFLLIRRRRSRRRLALAAAAAAVSIDASMALPPEAAELPSDPPNPPIFGESPPGDHSAAPDPPAADS